MAVSLYFTPSGFTAALYDEAIAKLEDAGAGFGKVPGRISHCAIEMDGAIAVFDIWNSMEEFEAFGATLVPILMGLGVDPGQPMAAPVHNMSSG
jgi:hypothetical protein